MPEYIAIGEISGVYGVRGWVKVHSSSRPREGILKYTSWYLFKNSLYSEFSLLNGRCQGKGIVAQLKGIDDRNQAQTLIATPIFIRKTQLAPTGVNEYYWRDLTGLNVTNLEGVCLGSVSHLVETGANDVMVIKGQKKEHLVPFTLNHTVKKVDLEQGVIEVDWDPDF